jgi:hypothetical protein
VSILTHLLCSHFRIRRWKRPAHPREQHWQPNASEHGLDAWVRPWPRWQGDRWANSSHAEAKRIRTWISSTKKHSHNYHTQFRKIRLRRKAKKKRFIIFVTPLFWSYVKFPVLKQKSTLPQTCHCNFLTAYSPATVIEMGFHHSSWC